VIGAVGHVSFTVADADVAADWYQAHLGCKLLHRQRQENAYTREFIGVPDAVLEVALLELPARDEGAVAVLELIEYVNPRCAGPIPRPGTRGYSHLSFFVTGIEDEYRRLTNAGATFVSAPVEITAGKNRGGWVCYFSDPDGNGLELFQPIGQ
jgi:catechol 2,3-dioxygenase-like lactoylglutathione lyase family enzyme